MKRLLAMVLAFALLIPAYPSYAEESLQGEMSKKTESSILSQSTMQEEVSAMEETGIRIDATEYGADPTGMRDSAEAIWQALEAAKELSEDGTKPVTIFFPKGEYHIYKDKVQRREYHTSNTSSTGDPSYGISTQFYMKHIGILIEDQNNLTIEGDGSLFMMHGDMMALAVVRSENVKLHNFSWDYAVPTVTEMTIIGMGTEEGVAYTDFYIPQCFDYEIQGNTILWKSDESPYTGATYWTRTGEHENSYSVVTHQPDSEMSRAYNPGQGPFGNVSSIRELEENKVRICYSNRPAMQKIGMVFQFCSSALRPTAGAFTWESKNVTAEKLNIHYMDGFGWLIQMSENVYYKDCNIMPRENSGHLTTSYADGIHASGAAGEIVIDHCNFSYTHDDPINIHGTFTRVEQRVDDYTLKLKYIHKQQGGFPQFHEGDKVQFFTRDTLESTDGESEYTVAEIISNPGENGNDLKTMEIRFVERLPENLSDTVSDQPKYVAENVTYAPKVTITNCIFKNIVTRGILCTTRNKVLIENNIFYPTSMATIYLSNDSNDWYESGPIRDMTIRGNIFYVDDIGRTSWANAPAIYVHPVTKGGGLPAAGNPIHKNIVIEENEFYMDEDAVVYAESVENLVFRNNKILRMNPDITLSLSPEATEMGTGEVMSLNFQKRGNTNDDDDDSNSGKDNIFRFVKSKDVSISGNTYDDGLKSYVVADADTENNNLQVEDGVLTIVRGENEPATAAVGEVTFVNSNPDVLYVDENGTAIGLSQGSATIYAYYEWNGTIIKSNEVTINVTGDMVNGDITILTGEWNDGFSVVREDTSKYEADKNSLSIDMQSGDLFQTSNSLKNLLLYEPIGVEKDNLRTIVKVEGMPVRVANGKWDTASFMLYKDDDNYITVGKKSHKNGFCSVVEKNQSAVESEGDSTYNNTTSGYLGITKNGNNVILSAKAEGEEWKQIAEITEHTLGNDYKIGFGVWGAAGSSVTFSDFKVGNATQTYEELEELESLSFLKEETLEIGGIEKNPVIDTDGFKSNHAKIERMEIEELGVSLTASQESALDPYYHVAAENGKSEIVLKVTKDVESDNVQVLLGDYRKQLSLEAEGNTYTTREPISLREGLNTIYVRVYAEDGITYQQHILAITYMPEYIEKNIVMEAGEKISLIGEVHAVEEEQNIVSLTKEDNLLPWTNTDTVEEGEFLFGKSGYIMTSDRAEGYDGVGLALKSVSMKQEDLEQYLWTIRQADNGWTMQNQEGKYVRIQNKNVTLVDQPEILEIFKGSTGGLQIKANGNYFNNFGGTNVNKLISGWTDNSQAWFFFVKSSGYIIEALEEGTTDLMSGKTIYHITVKGNSSDDDQEKENYYKVSFIDGSNVTEFTTVSDGSLLINVEGVKDIAVPVKEGYDFLGWFVGTEQYDINSVTVTGDLTLTAKWLKQGDFNRNQDDNQMLVDKVGDDTITDVAEKIWVTGVKNLTYNGKKQTFPIRVYDGTRLLTEKKDYTVTFKNNLNAKIFVETLEELATLEETATQKDTAGKKARKYLNSLPQVVIKMKGDYKGTKTLYFKINPKSISDNDILMDDIYVKETGKKQKVNVAATWNEKKLGSKDFWVTFPENVDLTTETSERGPIVLTITGKGNFAGSRVVNMTIFPKDSSVDMSKVKVAVPDNGKVPWTEAVKEGFTYSVSDNVLEKDSVIVKNGKHVVPVNSFTVSYEKNDQAGTATMILKGDETKGYFGIKRVTFRIVGTDIKNFDTSEKKMEYAYEGQEIKPIQDKNVKLVNKKNPAIALELKKDYEVAYSKNMDKGTATMTVTGNPKEGYVGSRKFTFKIIPVLMTSESVSARFTNGEKSITTNLMAGGAKPEVVVTHKGTILTEGKDYTLVYKNNKAGSKNEPTVIVNGKGNFSDKVSLNFILQKKPINAQGITVVIKDREVDLKKGKWLQSFQVYDEDGKALKAGVDYEKTAEYRLVNEDGSLSENVLDGKNSEIKKTATIHVTITGKGLYRGEGETPAQITAEYKLLAANHDISKAKIKIANKEYTGSVVTVSGNDFTQAEIGKGSAAVQLIEKDEKGNITKINFTIDENSYQKNDKKGTAKVTIRGEGEFGGEKTVTFKIVERNVEKKEKEDFINWWKTLMDGLLGKLFK